MLFNTFSYLFFLPLVFLLHWFVFNRSAASRNIFLCIASYFFYSCWDWRFSFLLLFVTVTSFIAGQRLGTDHSDRVRKNWLLTGAGIILGNLFLFKYFPFFSSHSGLVLPVGISFYSFHALSYLLDCYHRRIEPATDFPTYGVFVSFFPLLVAGPIERATHLLPQLKQLPTFDREMATDGVRQILWGLIKKMVLADLFASYADQVFDHYSYYSGSSLFLGGVFFAIQIYGDFSGYSDIAIGSGKLLGIRLLRNFNYPYFSQSMAEFWRRWHISLSSFFRDYLYIPLGGSKAGKARTIRNVLLVFLLTGLWHGAGFNFILWGLFNAFCVLPTLLWPSKQRSTRFRAFGGWLLTSILVVLGWILFRSASVTQAIIIFRKIFSSSLFSHPALVSRAVPAIVMAVIFFLVEWLGRRDEYALQSLGLRWPPVIRWGLYYFLFLVVAYFMGRANTFIYFQF